MTVFAPSIGSLLDLVEASGQDPAALLAEEGLDVGIAHNVGARVPAEIAERIALRAAKASGDPFFALREGEHLQPGHLGALGFAWLASPTLRDALERLERFEAMVNDQLDVRQQETDEGLKVILGFHGPAVDERLREDGALSVFMTICRMVAGEDFNPVAVHCQHSNPEDSSQYYALFRCPITFEADETAVVLPADQLDVRLTGGNEQIAAMSDHMVVKYLAWRDRSDIVNRVRTWILEHLADGAVTEEAAAEAMAMSARNLNRKLQEQDSSFKTLLNETRQSLAEQYITDQSLTLTEISFMLGFSEVSSFSRAFKRWTGQSPSKARGGS